MVKGQCKEEADSQWLHLYKGWPAEPPQWPSQLFVDMTLDCFDTSECHLIYL